MTVNQNPNENYAENNTQPVQAEETQPQVEQPVKNNVVLSDNEIALNEDVKERIAQKIKELKAKLRVRKVIAIVVEGDIEDGDSKPLYIAYFKRPDFAGFSQWMNFAQKDAVQANKMLAQNCFVDGDRELIDDDELFLFGTMSKITSILESRRNELVKIASVSK